ncbi:LysR family transcriptional regulator [Alkalihalobacillus sp. TS-13]|uniref:LysR family transcriptional regulator n=1 Tax=Alkalihalobacillus sp. TS-13 TaxID=2842455 RepID=UPI001C873E97|nr:LysR family transcriptional regulator [Alkalihalobacillus sp. TS-13]
METRDWSILQILYREKNITKAAKQLYISQPALTNRLKQIEKEFGVKIVNRGRRGIQFTSQGEYLAKCADEMLLRIRSIKENVHDMRDIVSGTLRLGVSNYFAHYQLPGVLKLFKDRFPNIEYKVTSGWSSEIAPLLPKKDIHIAFVKGDFNWVDEKHLLFDETICVVSKDRIQLDELPELPRIDYRSEYSLKSVIDNWWAEHYTHPPLINIEVDKVDTCKEMVLNGLGYAIMPSMILRDTEGLYTIDLKTKAGEPLLRRTWMLYHKESLNLNMVREFVSFIKSIDMNKDY